MKPTRRQTRKGPAEDKDEGKTDATAKQQLKGTKRHTTKAGKTGSNATERSRGEVEKNRSDTKKDGKNTSPKTSGKTRQNKTSDGTQSGDRKHKTPAGEKDKKQPTTRKAASEQRKDAKLKGSKAAPRAPAREEILSKGTKTGDETLASRVPKLDPKIPGAKPKPGPTPVTPGGVPKDEKETAKETVAPGRLPILCLPIRVETRFYDQDKPRLRIRIYPDRIHLDRHDPRLSKSEVAMAEKAKPVFVGKKVDDERRLKAWRSLVDQLGQFRAAYVLQRIVEDTIKAERADEDAMSAFARLLPRRWRVRGYAGPSVAFDEEFANPVKANLSASPLPDHLDQDGIRKDSPIAWMADFDAARDAGMADEFRLYGDAMAGFSEMIVIGQPHPKAASFNPHFAAQSFTVGAGFMPQGTATNNTEEARTGWSGHAGELDQALHRLLPKGLNTPPAEAAQDGTHGRTAPKGTQVENADLFSRALGIDAPSDLPFAKASDDFLQRCMNQALWPVTWGAYIDDLLGYSNLLTHFPPDFLSVNDIAYLRDLFVGYLRGGASLPVYRSGETPYGTALSSKNGKVRGGDARRDRLVELVETLTPLWDDASRTIPHLRDGVPRNQLSEDFAEILTRVPHPRNFSLTQLFDKSTQINGYFDLYRWALFEQHIHVDRVEQWFQVRQTGSQARAEYCDSARAQRGQIEGIKNHIDLMYFDWRVSGSVASTDTAGIEARRLSNGQHIPLHRPTPSDCNDINLRRPQGWPVQSEEDCLQLAVSVAETRILCENLMAHLDEHEARNESFALAGAPTSVYKSTIGSGHEDPDIAFALYGTEIRDWPEDHLIEILDDDGNGVQASEWLAYVIGKLQADVGQGTEPAEPDWGTSGEKPLLFYLINRAASLRRSALVKSGLTPGEAHSRPGARGAGRNRWAISGYASDQVRARADHYQMIDALSELSRHGPQTLRLAMRQTLDLSGWRLDAFWQAFQVQDLDAYREQVPAGSRVSAWSYLEEVRPRWRRSGALVSESFVQAPSLTHAKTAGLLRSGRAARSAGAATDAMAVDLSSNRMRKAIWCFQALRDGADLGELLGSMAERALTDQGAPELIDPLRRAVRALSGEEDGVTPPLPVDGLDLLALWGLRGATKSDVIDAMAYADGEKPSRPNRVGRAVSAIENVADAMTDLALADATFDLVRGETANAATTLSAIADGSAPLPDLKILETPDDGPVVTTHAMLVSGNEPEPQGWPDTPSLRAQLDPASEKLARQALGRPDRLMLRIVAGQTRTVPLSQLMPHFDAVPSALDVLSMAIPGAGKSPLEREIERAAGRLFGNAEAHLATEDPGSGLLVIEAWRKSFMDARPALPEDMISLGLVPDDAETNTEGAGRNAYGNRLRKALAALDKAVSQLEDVLPPATAEDPNPVNPESDPDSLRQALARLAPFNAWGLAEMGETQGVEALQSRAWTVLQEKRALHNAIIDKLGKSKALTAAQLREHAKSLFGSGLHVPARFPETLSHQIASNLTDSQTRMDAVARSPLGWLSDIGRVSSAARDVSECLMLEVADYGTSLRSDVAQFPEPGGPEAWFAQSAPQNGRDCGSALLLSRCDQPISDLQDGFEALVLETVIDRIPPTDRVAGLALELETPNAEAPQVMLLVLPDEKTTLKYDDAFSAVRNLMAWVRRRSVDGGDLPELDQHLPAVYSSDGLWDIADANYGGGT